jgi:hypothetical protein
MAGPRAFAAPSSAELRASAQPRALHVGGAVRSEHVAPSVLERLESIRELADTSHRALPGFEERQHANAARGEAQRRLEQLTAHPSTSFGGSMG